MNSATRTLASFALVAAAGLPLLGLSIDPPDPSDAWRDGWHSLAADSDDGFFVWESNRNGRWRIYRRELSGDGLRQLTPDEPERDHFCPHLSPDGTRMVYVSLQAGADLYEKRAVANTGTMHIARTDGTDDRVLVGPVRAYYEDRAALWVDDNHLFYISGDATTYRLNVDTGERVERHRWNAEEPWGWLPNSTETHITPGWPSFPPFDAERKRVLYRNTLQGCQPYFSLDGRWGFYTGGAGGPLNRYDLTTRRISPIIVRHDERLPEDRRYFYFPMLSACQTAFAFGASFYEHDHFKSDYDVFIARIDPFTLEIDGVPQRYTFDANCDRFPDVHYTRLRLGKQRGMVPFTVDFEDRLDGSWQWAFGDGSSPKDSARHVYEAPGKYWVVASRGDESRRGFVRVDPLTGPRATAARLIEARVIAVEFDGPVRIPDGATATMSSEAAPAVTGLGIGDSPNTLLIRLDRGLRQPTELAFRGVVGEASPNLPVVAEELIVQRLTWPVDPDRLVYAFEHGQADNLAREFGTGAQVAFGVSGVRAARFDRNFAMSPFGSHFEAAKAADNIIESCKASGEFAFQGIIEPAAEGQSGTVIALGSTADGAAFAIQQREGEYLVRVATSESADAIELSFRRPRRPIHFEISVKSKGHLTFRVDGNTHTFREGLRGDFSTWRTGPLRFGGDGWRGAIHHVAVFDRTRLTDESERDYRRCKEWLDAVPPIETKRVRGKLVAKAVCPGPGDIEYPDALAVFEWSTADGPVRVAHWVMLDNRALDAAQLAIGTELDLELEPLDLHPEARDRCISEDGLEENFDLEPWFDARR